MRVCVEITGRKGRGGFYNAALLCPIYAGTIFSWPKTGVFREIFFDLFAYVEKKLYLCMHIRKRLYMDLKRFICLPLSLLVTTMMAEPVIRVVQSGATDKVFSADTVRKLVLSASSVDVVSNEGISLLSVPVADILRVEFSDGTPNIQAEIETTTVENNDVIKIIEDGQVFILLSGKKYTIMGIEVVQK